MKGTREPLRMPRLEPVIKVFLLGIGGIGMSGLARYFKRLGCAVAGYDKQPTRLTKELAGEGMEVFYDDEPAKIPAGYLEVGDDLLVIFTPAVAKTTRVFTAFEDRGISPFKRSEVLGAITKDHFTIAIAGTHGKTTIGAMVAHLLHQAANPFTAFLGGIAVNFGTNFLYEGMSVVLVEADEYDRSFLSLFPDVAVITAMDDDHMEIYGDRGQLIDAFNLFAAQVKTSGLLLVKAHLPIKRTHLSYGLDQTAEASGYNIAIQGGQYVFAYHDENGTINDISLGVPGHHNVENAVAAIRIARYLGIPDQVVVGAMASFKGVKRRFETIHQDDNILYIDDYAHHPHELDALLNTSRELYPGRKITLVFQPHLYSRTRDLEKAFAVSLSRADVLILMQIYPAREAPIPGVNAAHLLAQVEGPSKHLLGPMEILAFVQENPLDLLLTAGAGDIDQMVCPIKEILENIRAGNGK